MADEDDGEAMRFNNRRRMAWRAFWIMAISGAGLIGGGLYSPTAAEAIDKLSWLVQMYLGLWITIILAYFGVTGFADFRRGA